MNELDERVGYAGKALRTRMPAVAGLFYPSDPSILASEVDTLLADARDFPGEPKGVVAPHAGYVYSGPVAATAFRHLARRKALIRRVVLFGPAHRVHLRGLAIPDVDAMRTPLGDLQVDRASVRAALAVPHVDETSYPHEREHGIEVELPFLQRSLGSFVVVPVVVGMATPEEVGSVMEALWGGDETAIVVSSDLSHGAPYDVAKQSDLVTARALERLAIVDPGSACGAFGLGGLAWIGRRRGLRVRRLDLRNSGDTHGARGEVVGYGAFGIYEPSGAE